MLIPSKLILYSRRQWQTQKAQWLEEERRERERVAAEYAMEEQMQPGTEQAPSDSQGESGQPDGELSRQNSEQSGADGAEQADADPDAEEYAAFNALPLETRVRLLRESYEACKIENSE